jgi:invasion protein IalB
MVHVPRRKYRPSFREIVTMNLVRIAASALALATAAPAAFAADAPPPVSAEPQNTSATYGDWILRCARANDGNHACEVIQPFQMQVQGQSQPIGQLAIGHRSANAKEPMHVTFLITPGISFPSDVRLMSDDKDTQPVVLDWSSCSPSICRADGEFKDDQLKRWKAATANGKLIFKLTTGQPFTIPVSVRGLAQALDALPKS